MRIMTIVPSAQAAHGKVYNLVVKTLKKPPGAGLANRESITN